MKLKITITIDKKEVHLSEEEARDIYAKLSDLFPPKVSIVMSPVTESCAKLTPVVPYTQPYYPQWNPLIPY